MPYLELHKILVLLKTTMCAACAIKCLETYKIKRDCFTTVPFFMEKSFDWIMGVGGLLEGAESFTFRLLRNFDYKSTIN